MAEDWKHAGEVIRKRRKQLRLRQEDLQGRGGPSAALVRSIERGRYSSDMQDAMRAGLERSLEWTEGSLAGVLEGGEPVVANGSPLKEFASQTHRAPDDAAPDAERLFGEWADLYTKLLPVEFRYSTARGIDLDEAQEELREILNMAQQASREGRMWTPPWKWNRPGRPWLESWWSTSEATDFQSELSAAIKDELEAKERREQAQHAERPMRAVASDPTGQSAGSAGEADAIAKRARAEQEANIAEMERKKGEKKPDVDE